MQRFIAVYVISFVFGVPTPQLKSLLTSPAGLPLNTDATNGLLGPAPLTTLGSSPSRTLSAVVDNRGVLKALNPSALGKTELIPSGVEDELERIDNLHSFSSDDFQSEHDFGDHRFPINDDFESEEDFELGNDHDSGDENDYDYERNDDFDYRPHPSRYSRDYYSDNDHGVYRRGEFKFNEL